MSERLENFEEFKQALADKVRAYLPEEYQGGIIQFDTVKKSGLGDVTGMTIRKPGELVAPCLYIDSAYESHLKYGITIDTIAEKIGNRYGEAIEGRNYLTMDSDTRELLTKGFSWDVAKEICFIKAVPVSNNQEYLMNLPHRTQGDIAAIYQIDLGEFHDGQMTLSVTNELAEKMGVMEDTLYQAALKNTMEKRPPHIINLDDTVITLLEGKSLSFDETFQEELAKLPDVSEDDRQLPISILMNSETSQGAAILFSREVMDSLACKYPDGFYILPSSIHETMIVAKSDHGMTLEEMNQMVKEINRAEVCPEERLSDYVHEYDPMAKSLYIAGTEAPSKVMKAEEQKQNASVHSR